MPIWESGRIRQNGGWRPRDPLWPRPRPLSTDCCLAKDTGRTRRFGRLNGAGPLTVFIGDGPERERLVRRAGELNLSRVRFLEAVPRADVPGLLASADVAMVPLKIRLPGAVLSKIYEAMASGPVLLVADGEAADIVREAGAGVAVEPGDTRRSSSES